jgi:hypothetical protein
VERRVLQSCGKNHKSLHQDEVVIVIQAVFGDVIEEALGF